MQNYINDRRALSRGKSPIQAARLEGVVKNRGIKNEKGKK